MYDILRIGARRTSSLKDWIHGESRIPQIGKTGNLCESKCIKSGSCQEIRISDPLYRIRLVATVCLLSPRSQISIIFIQNLRIPSKNLDLTPKKHSLVKFQTLSMSLGRAVHNLLTRAHVGRVGVGMP